VAQLSASQSALQAKGARLAAIGLGERNYARLFRAEIGMRFPLLIDEKREAYRAAGLKRATPFHVFRRDNAGARRRARAAGHRQHRSGKNPLQLGGTFVFGPGNTDRFAHVSETFGDTAPMEAVLAALDSAPPSP
jgi:hypothetical protein